MPNQVRVGVGVSGVPKAVSELDQMRDKFRKTAFEIGEAGKNGGFAFGIGAGVAAKGVDLIAGSAYKAGQAIGDFVHDSIKAASDLNESTSKSQVIFGKSSAAVDDFAAHADKALGLSKQAALEAAASFGNLFLGTGKSQAEAAGLSTKLVALAGDLASFNNIDPTLALEKLRSGLTGESEPLRSVGVFLTEAKVKAKGMKLGLADAHGELSEGAKVMARYAIILDETKTAQGDFARTSEGLANAQRIENAELTNLQATLGQKMLPAQLAVTKAQVQFFQGLSDVADGIGGKVTPRMIALAAAQNQLGPITAGVRAQIHDLGWDAVQAAHEVGIFTDAEFAAEGAARRHAMALDFMAAASKDDTARIVDDGKSIGGIVELIGRKAGTAEDQFAAAMKGLVGDVRKAKDDLGTAGNDAADAFFDPQIAKLEEYKNAREIKETEIAIHSGKLRGAELTDAKIKILQLKKDRIGLLTTLAEAGDKNARAELLHIAKTNIASKNASKDQKAYWQGVIDKITGLNSAVNDLNADLKRLSWQASHTKDDVAQIPGLKTAQTGGTRHLAGGGHVSADEAVIVGENHPEVFVPDRDGTILPNAPTSLSGGGSSGGSSMTFAPTVVVQGLATPAVKEAIVRDLGPLLATWLRQNGYR